jgi:protein-S-isoprenylcysteine O-methyltransferase Ste14
VAGTQGLGYLAWLALYWLAYFVVHSLLASLAAKRSVARRWPRRMPLYRLAFNAIALLLLLPAAALVHAWDGPLLWRWTGGWWWLAQGVALVALLLFLHASRCYDTGEFLGLRQWRSNERRVEDQERFRISPYHRFVRHPWYALGLVMLWTRQMDAAALVSACAITLYLLIGLRLEERKLLVLHGARYRAYRDRVPALLPRPWRRLSPKEAERLSGGAGSGLS